LKGILTLVTFFPIIGSLLIVLLPARHERLPKTVALIFSSLTFLISLVVLFGFKLGAAGLQMIEKYPMVKSLRSSYFLGVDGISLPLVLLTTFLVVLAVIASWNIQHPKGYFAFVLMLETSLIGVFLALDFILFYLFWEFTLIPMYFLIGVWGGKRRAYATLKFFVYTFFGSIFMLLSIILVYFNAPERTFDMISLANLNLPVLVQKIVFFGFFLGLGIKIPIFPFHTWLPDAHVEAPTAVSVLLAGVLLKMGGYGFFRIVMPMLPVAFKAFAVPLAILGVISIIYGAFCAMAQQDLKKLVAYSSVSHMGYVVLGLAAANSLAINGAMVQMISHGLTSGMLFLLVGFFYERTHTRNISDLGGLLTQLPVLSGILCFAAFASLGLPGLSGFVGEFMVLLGTYRSMLVLTIIAAPGIIITAYYHLWMIQKVVMGALPEKFKVLKDASTRELVILIPVITMTVLLGFYPKPLVSMVNGPIFEILKRLK